ncbi:MAG: hypothetical protein Q8P41_05490 [Pseudomonadota bacterium]|nr:hypothetical protein [Pseudomonadota bacterium]
MRSFLLVLPLLVGCKPAPPDAPEELNELVGYLYTNVPGEDPAPLEVGAVNLDVWLQERIDETLVGYTVDNLTPESIEALGEGERDLEELAGAAVGHVSVFPTEELVTALVVDDPMNIYPGTYVSFEREFDGDPECFASGECDWLEAEVHASFDYVLMQVQTHSRVQYRWIDSEVGRVYVERTWLREAAVVTSTFIEVDQQYYLRVVLPDGEGTRSIQATWVVARLVGDMPENAALNLLIDSMSKQAVKLDEYVETR